MTWAFSGKWFERYGCMVCVFAIVLMGLSGQLSAAIWTEVVDAGDIPGSAQVTSGSGTLNTIVGTIDNSLYEDIDMFAIQVSDPGNFSASLFSDPLTGLLDTYLFVFDSAGRGVVADNDAFLIPGPLDPISEIHVGALTGQSAGLYYLAISTGLAFLEGDLPLDGYVDFIFDPLDLDSDTGSGNVLPVSNDPITAWNLDSDDLDDGAYEIQLTGTEYANEAIPEPSSFLVWSLIGVIFCVLAIAERR